MTWLINKPANSDNLASSDKFLRDNFEAIETGLVPYDYISLQDQSSTDPTTATGFGYLYAKQASSKPELHWIDEDDNVIQLTSAGSFGNSNFNVDSSGNLDCTSISFDGGTNTFNASSMVKAWATFIGTSGGFSVLDSYNCTPTRDSQGVYTLTWGTNFGSANYVVVGTAQSVSGNARIVMESEATAKAAGAAVINVRDTSGSVQDSGLIDVVAIGDR